MNDQTVIPRVRAIIVNGAGQFVAQVNNRVSLGNMTVMLPGGDIRQGEGELTALARHVRDEVGITMQLDPSNCRFLASRTYEFDGDGCGKQVARVNFYAIDSDGAVPRNMDPESVVSLSWMSLADLKRYVDLGSGNWKVMLGAMEAIEMALDPSKAKAVEGGREIAHQDGGKAPSDEGASRPSRLPYGPAEQ